MMHGPVNLRFTFRRVSVFTIKQAVYSANNTTLVYDIGILLWQHVSAFLRPSSGQRTYVSGTVSAYFIRM